MENSLISWTDHTFNPWMGCTKISPGCTNCYAEREMDTRMGKVKWGPMGGRIKTSPAYWQKPLTWNKAKWLECPACGWRGSWEAARSPRSSASNVVCPGCGQVDKLIHARQRVFCASLADVYEDRADLMDWRSELLDLITATHNLDWLLLTKRPENVMSFSHFSLPENVWIGTTVENQEVAEKRINALIEIPARVRFLSCEPLIGPINLGLAGTLPNWKHLSDKIHWVIAGGESGPKARPMHPDWARSLRDECVQNGVPFHFKQWGEWLPAGQRSPVLDQLLSESSKYHDFGNCISVRIGKKNAGHILDGKEWLQFPDV